MHADAFEILIFANNCTDATAQAARDFSALVPHRIIVVEDLLPPSELSAGAARKRAMDLAAARLIARGAADGVILTTDADSCVAPTWFAATMRELQRGVDCVAGYIDAEPLEIVNLGAAFLARGRLEDTYLRLLAEIAARCDPRPHDPWPNHRVSSGASLAVTLSAYRTVGGLPLKAVGEDAALTAALELAGLKVRHSMTVSVLTSCRLDGRAQGGAADTMRLRHEQTDAPCDGDLEPALQATRRAIYRGHLRRALQQRSALHLMPRRWNVSSAAMATLAESGVSFESAWRRICDDSPALRRGPALRPSELPRQITIARLILQQLRQRISAPTIAPVGTPDPAGWLEPAA